MYIMDTRKIREFMTKDVKNFLIYNNWLGESILTPIFDGLALSDDTALEAGAAYLQKGFRQKVPIEQAKVGYLAYQLCREYFSKTPIPEKYWLPFVVDVTANVTKYARVYDQAYFEENHYFANITVPNVEIGDISLGHAAFEEGDVSLWNPLRPRPIRGLNFPIACISWTTDPVKYPVLYENGVAWMSITPNEIETMRKQIEEASGEVLTLGCGLGYYAYMVSEKRNVSSVTIVEKNPAVIDIFREYILPQFPYEDKVQIVQADAFDYLRSIEDGQYTYCFADLWAHSSDIVPYLKVHRICDRFTQTKVSYWIQDGLDMHIQSSILSRLSAKFRGEDHLIAATKNLMKREAEEDPSSVAAMQLEGELLLSTILDGAKFKSVADILHYLDVKAIASMLPDAA